MSSRLSFALALSVVLFTIAASQSLGQSRAYVATLDGNSVSDDRVRIYRDLNDIPAPEGDDGTDA